MSKSHYFKKLSLIFSSALVLAACQPNEGEVEDTEAETSQEAEEDSQDETAGEENSGQDEEEESDSEGGEDSEDGEEDSESDGESDDDSDEDAEDGNGEESDVAGVELSDEKPEVAEVEDNNAPNRIITTFNGDSQTQMGFNWYTTEAFDDAKVWVSTEEDLSDAQEFEAEVEQATNRYGERTEDGHFIFADVELDDEGEPVEEDGEPIINGYYTDENVDVENKDWTGGEVGQLELIDVDEHVYKAVATDLEPGTTYYYQVGSEEGEKSEVGSFKTSGGDDDSFTFIQYTDTQNAYWNEHVRNEASFGADTIAKALETVEDPDFVVHSGDVVEIAEVEDEWVDLFTQSEESFLQIPFIVAPGNHDEYALAYDDDMLTEAFNQHINVPAANDAIDGGSYYSVTYNNAHIVTLNTNDNKESDDNPDGKAIGDEQLAWIEEDINQARENGAEWIILNYHKPLFSKSYHSLQDEDVQLVREEFMELIDRLDVDLALQGHDHVISQTKPLTFVPSDVSFSNAEVDEESITEEDGVKTYTNPEGTVFVLPNNGGTKAYDDIYSKNIDRLHEVRPKLDWLTEEDVEYWNNLFEFGEQPQDAPEFEDSHSNARDSAIQNFAVYTVESNRIAVEIYQIEGELLEGEDRNVELAHEFEITKD